MNANHSIELVVYGLIVGALNLVVYRIAPGFAGAAPSLLVAGGVLIMFMGVLGLSGLRRLFWPIVTLIMVAGLVLVQAAKAWLAVKSGVDGAKPVAVILSLLVFFAMMQLVNFAQSARHSCARNRKSTENTANDDGVNDENPKHIRPSLHERR